MGYAVFAALAAFILIGLYSGLALTTYRIKSDKIKSDRPIKLLLITDLHDTFWGKGQHKLIDMAKKAAPDAIMLVGDITEVNHGAKATEALLSGICPLAPTYFVTGSHDLQTWDIDGVDDLMQKHGVTVLRYASAALKVGEDTLKISGVDEPFAEYIRGIDDKDAYRAEYARNVQSFPAQDKDAYNILLAHCPEFGDVYRDAGYDLCLSGHAHGGQWRLPLLLPNGLYAPGQGLFPKYTGGLYPLDSLTLIVSRGLHHSLLRPRFFNRPNLVLIEITREDEKP